MKLNTFRFFLLFGIVLSFSGCASYEGMQILSPEHEQTVEELQPTLQWEAVPGKNVTYDLVLYEAEEVDPVYHKEGLVETTHRVELELKPQTTYRWSVRSKKNGEVSDWTKYETKVFTGVSYHRRAKYMRFTTP